MNMHVFIFIPIKNEKEIFKMKKIVKVAIMNCAVVVCFVLGFLVLGSHSVSAATAKPTGLTQTKGDENSVTVTCNTVAGEDVEYYYKISENASLAGATAQSAWDEPWVYADGLQSGKTYYVQIGAIGEDDSSINWSDPLKVVTAPSSLSDTSIKFVSATEQSITLNWSAVSGATGYNVMYYPAGTSASQGKSVTTASASVTVSNLDKNASYYFEICPYRVDGKSFKALQSYSDIFFDARTLPTKVTGLDCTYFDPSVKTGRATFEWKRTDNADGYQYEIYTYNGKTKLLSGDASSYDYYGLSIKNSKLKTRQVYRIRVRAYITNSDGKKICAAWSSYDYFSRCAAADTSIKKSGGKMNVAWSKVKGATGYTIYLSTNGKTFKKVAATKKTTYKINQTVKAKKTYYVRVVPYYKNATYSATVNYKGSYSAYLYVAKSKHWYVYH